jgi:hypothetical protein
VSTNGTSVVQWAGGQEHLGGAQTMLVAARDFTAGQVVGTATGKASCEFLVRTKEIMYQRNRVLVPKKSRTKEITYLRNHELKSIYPHQTRHYIHVPTELEPFRPRGN